MSVPSAKIYGVDGQFGSGKTSSAVYLASVMQGPKTCIISNVRMSDVYIQNYFHFDESEFLGVLRTINAINDKEREFYSRKLPSRSGKVDENSIFHHMRDQFTRFVVIFDELGGNMTATEHKDVDPRINQYILQCRKMNADLFLVSQRITRMVKVLRENIDWVLYAQPFWDFWIFKDFITIRKKKIDEEGKTQTMSYLGKDPNGDYVKKEKPLDFYLTWFWGPSVWKMYDDWHKNIKDPEKNLVIPRIYENFKFREPKEIVIEPDFIDFLKFLFDFMVSLFRKPEPVKKQEEAPEGT